MRFLIWQFGELGKDHLIKNSPIWIIACMPMALRIQITKLKICQYLLRANLPKFNARQIFPLYGMPITSLPATHTVFIQIVAAATVDFSLAWVWLLIECGSYLRAAFINSD